MCVVTCCNGMDHAYKVERLHMYTVGKAFISDISNGIFCGDCFHHRGKIGNNVLQLAGIPLRLSPKNKTDSKLLLESNLKTNSENIC